MYKLSKPNRDTGEINTIFKNISIDSGMSIPFDPNNSDFIEFKRQINEDESQLQDADGNTMTAAEAKEFVATLP
jgi:hypothetical protein